MFWNIWPVAGMDVPNIVGRVGMVMASDMALPCWDTLKGAKRAVPGVVGGRAGISVTSTLISTSKVRVNVYTSSGVPAS